MDVRRVSFRPLALASAPLQDADAPGTLHNICQYGLFVRPPAAANGPGFP